MQWKQDTYLKALKFAATCHREQKVPGGELPYVVHLCQVAMEVMAQPECDDLALCCALLHDCLEDTPTQWTEVEQSFGRQVASGVEALTKNAKLPKSEQMLDSLTRLQSQPFQVQMVKLADRITNLQEPPHYWTPEKRAAYQAEARVILEHLGTAHQGLAQRLEQKIESYSCYLGK